jgi:hypothetical protein
LSKVVTASSPTVQDTVVPATVPVVPALPITLGLMDWAVDQSVAKAPIRRRMCFMFIVSSVSKDAREGSKAGDIRFKIGAHHSI